ncbi:MAG TPA: hypothetical protein PLU80_21275, partial [Acidobacteriota bacterium]|nr:hypothetical protein [Acidobacteriota bacterium]
VQESRDRERSTEKIGEMIMRKLKELDKVAYVRFASVYLEFKDVTEFMAELKSLMKNPTSLEPPPPPAKSSRKTKKSES